MPSDFKVEALIDHVVIFFLVELVQAGGTMGYVGFNFIEFFQNAHLNPVVAKVPFVQFPAQDFFIHLLQLAQREFLRQQFKSYGLIPDLSLQPFMGCLQDQIMVESQFGNFVQFKPCGIAGIR